MRRTLTVLAVLLAAQPLQGCSLEDECGVPSGSRGGFCEGGGYLHCVWDSRQGRNRYRFVPCIEGYTCKDRLPLSGTGWSQYTALCVWARAAYPACGTVQDKQACDGKHLISCDRGYRVSHLLCINCTTSQGVADCQGGLGAACDPGPCLQGATCTPWGPVGAGSRCVATCDCEYQKPCPACARFGSGLTCDRGECRERSY